MHLKSNNQKRSDPNASAEASGLDFVGQQILQNSPTPQATTNHTCTIQRARTAKKQKKRSLQDFDMQYASQIWKIMATCFTTMYNNANTFPTRFQHVSNMFPTCFQHVSNMFQHVPNMFPTCSNFLQNFSNLKNHEKSWKSNISKNNPFKEWQRGQSNILY